MDLLVGLEPDRVFHFFEAISDIPRNSGATEGVRAWLKGFAEERGLACSTDEAGNVLIVKDGSAGRTEEAPVILQAHMDMVCVKNPESYHDFSSEPLELFVEGDELYADGTSLGADDGIGVAMILAVLDSDGISHPPIEALFTNDEEIGLLGAAAFDTASVKGRRMINLDSEDEAVITCGCAGGATVYCILPVEKIRMKGLPVVLTITGLNGGHSGADIDKWRANANKLAGRLLNELSSAAAYSLESVTGGEKDNAIPTEARIRIVIDEEDYQAVLKTTESFEKSIHREYRGIEDHIRVRIEKGTVHKMDVFDMETQDKALALLLSVPNGIAQMSGSMPGLVQSSANLGVVRTTDKEFAVTVSVRSSVMSARNALELRIRELAEHLGAAIMVNGAYPSWEFRENSPLRDAAVAAYTEVYGREPEIVSIHAGLECACFASRIRGLDAISIGPEVTNIHSVSERLSISSVERTWKCLTRLLGMLN